MNNTRSKHEGPWNCPVVDVRFVEREADEQSVQGAPAGVRCLFSDRSLVTAGLLYLLCLAAVGVPVSGMVVALVVKSAWLFHAAVVALCVSPIVWLGSRNLGDRTLGPHGVEAFRRCSKTWRAMSARERLSFGYLLGHYAHFGGIYLE